jgi:hypothetical protein
MTTARPDSRLGTDLGPYRIERVLGRGGMGVVYLAEQRELGRKVALKLLPDELAQDADFRARFERESRLAAAIDHPNIIPLYEAGEIDGVLFLAMRFVNGVDLASRLRDGPLPSPTAIEILDQVAGALDAAHEKGLVHRDVKPGNVLLDRTGSDERPHAYLTDFGLTKQAGSDSGLTRAGAFLGTPAYMAPEQVDGTEVDGRADEYALGAMAFECLTGRVPFVRGKEVAVALAHLKDPVPSAVAMQPSLPASVDTVLAKVMAKDREARYPSCAAFVEDLRSALGGRAVVARPVPSAQRRRTPLVVAAALGLGLVAVAGLALASGLVGPGSAPTASLGSAAGAKLTSPFPDRNEAALMAALPRSSSHQCERGSGEPLSTSGGGEAIPVASIVCSEATSGAIDQLEVWQFPSTSGALVGSIIAKTAVDNGVEPGDCATAALATGPWAVINGEANTAPGSLASGESDSIGSLVCYRTAGAAVIEWTYDTADIVARATVVGGDSSAAYAWWSLYGPRFVGQ